MKFSVAAALHHEIEPSLQRIEVWSTLAIPSFRVVGLPGPEIIESCERVRAAIDSSGFEFPKRRILVNLSPAGIRKQGTGTDLAIALAILLPRSNSKLVASGELGLDGSVRSSGKITRTCLAAVLDESTHLILAHEDRDATERAFSLIHAVHPQKCLPQVQFVSSLAEALDAAQSLPFSPDPPTSSSSPCSEHTPMLSQELLMPAASLFRKLQACSLGSHSLLLLGPKGTGKTASLKWLSFLREPLGPRDLLEQLKVQELLPCEGSGVGLDSPVREISPHVRAEALIGGFHNGQLRPGELTLAHGGLLIADEFLEWRRDAREALRDPIESGRVILQRAQKRVALPARFTFAGTANLCPCGGVPPELQSELTQCRCSPRLRQAYLERLSGPILDRMDCVDWVMNAPEGLSRGAIPTPIFKQTLEKVIQGRAKLRSEWGELPGRTDAKQVESWIQAFPRLSELQAQWGTPEASLRRRHREIRLAISLATLDDVTFPEPRHFLESRPVALDRLQKQIHPTPIHFLAVSNPTPTVESLTPLLPTP